MARESNLSATETEAATSALYRVEKELGVGKTVEVDGEKEEL